MKMLSRGGFLEVFRHELRDLPGTLLSNSERKSRDGGEMNDPMLGGGEVEREGPEGCPLLTTACVRCCCFAKYLPS